MTLKSWIILTPVLTVGFLAGCSSAERQKMENRAEETADQTERAVDNVALTTAVKAKLAADVRVGTLTSVNVDSTGSTVTLSGHVKTVEEKDYAESIAKTVEGVAVVVNRLEIRP